MLEGSMPSIWASIFSWFTPTVLFVLTNVMIATIVATSIFGTQKNQPEDENRPQLVRTSSVLERLRSFSLYRYRSGEMDPFPSSTTLPPADTETQQTPEPAEEETLQDQGPDPAHAYQVQRIKSDTKPASGEMPVKLSRKLKKSASAKSAFAHFEEKEIVDSIRPSTTKDGKSKGSELQRFGEDEEVDARADDFINRFKQQLKLQRLDSILRYKEMLNRGAG